MPNKPVKKTDHINISCSSVHFLPGQETLTASQKAFVQGEVLSLTGDRVLFLAHTRTMHVDLWTLCLQKTLILSMGLPQEQLLDQKRFTVLSGKASHGRGVVLRGMPLLWSAEWWQKAPSVYQECWSKAPAHTWSSDYPFYPWLNLILYLLRSKLP